MLSQFECDHIIEMGTKVIRESMVGQGGGFKSKTRTSRNGWLRRSASPTLERIYKRFGDVLGIDHELLSSNKNAEELQVVRYQQSQEYAPHHDFGDDSAFDVELQGDVVAAMASSRDRVAATPSS